MTTHTPGRALRIGLAAVACAAFLGAVVTAPSAAAASATGASARGELLSVTPVGHLSRSEVVAAVASIPFDTAPVRHGVTGYRITYRTVDAAGRPTTASGLVELPDGGLPELRVISYGHGTQAYRGGVASMVAGNGDREAVEYFASAGYAAVAPDYLGLGTGPGTHPYMDTATEATAWIDMLRASRTLASRHGRRLDPGVLLTGFSQGGTAAMATGRALQNGADPYWKPAALAPVSGPYDVRRAEIPAMFLTGGMDPAEAAFYMGYWTVSMNRLHHLYDSPSEVFRAPYDTFVEGLYDGEHTEESIAAELPDSPAELLTPQYVRRLLHPTGALLAALRDNDTTCQWHPDVPVRLYAAEGDRDAVFANALHCRRQLRAHGADVPLVDVGDTDHVGSVIRAIPQVLDWFARQD
ncbi:hypothetical protein [Streptomyces sp. NPDC047061]|uniref:hypothetical protein n=1 Tax=Streptomyces sp. NPDC047061 TaxID=3154605 RepID=UPI0033C365D0